MIDKKKKFNFKYLLIYILTILCLFSSLSSLVVNISNAEDIEYSNVLEDLQKDETFNIEDYPVVEKDYSLKIIQIAESNQKELFIYTYQPFYQDYATSINISTGINDNLKYKNYTLSFINNSNTLFKYKVNDFQIKDDALRYYDISSIFRKYDKDIDGSLPGENEGNEKSYEVAKLYTASTVNGNVTYTCLSTKTVEIKNKYVGFVRFLNGFWLWEESCDSHYIAFSTEYSIDKLMEADVTYIAEIGSGSLATGRWTADKVETIEKTLKADDKASNDPSGPLGNKYTWKRIEKVSEFINNSDNNLSNEIKENIKDMQWVLRFVETSYTEFNGMWNPHYDATRVKEVTILRLKFEINGEVFNLGVVDNKQTGDTSPDGETDRWQLFLKWLERIFYIIIAISLLALIIAFFPVIWPVILIILKFIFNCVIWLFKGLYYVFIKCPLSWFIDE